MAIKHLPNGYKPLVNQCGVKFDVQRVCTEEDTGPQVLTLNWPSNVEQYALYAASCLNAGGASCGQYASMPERSMPGSASQPLPPDPDKLIFVYQDSSVAFDTTGYPDRGCEYIWTNSLGTPIRILDVRFYANGAVGTSPGGDASQGQNAINRAQGVGVLPTWELVSLETFFKLDYLMVAMALRKGEASQFVWPKNEQVLGFANSRCLWSEDLYFPGFPLFPGQGWWEFGGTLQSPIDSAANPNLGITANQDNQDQLDYVLNPGEKFALTFYQDGMTWFTDNPVVAVFAPMTIEITYEQAEAHP